MPVLSKQAIRACADILRRLVAWRNGQLGRRPGATLEELLAERGIAVDHVTVYRWVPTFPPVLIDAAGPAPARSG